MKNGISRAEQKLLTRKKLIDTTLDVIAEGGLSSVTMARVAVSAGLSQGICNFHFKSKDQLLLEVLKVVIREFRETWKNIIKEANLAPSTRLRKMIEVLLSPPVASTHRISVWFAFWGEARFRKKYLTICQTFDRELEDDFETLVRELIAGNADNNHVTSPKIISLGVIAMIDGYHLDFLLTPDLIGSEIAIQSCLAFLRGQFPKCDDFLF